MDFNFNPEDEAFRMEFRAWLNANKQFAPHMGGDHISGWPRVAANSTSRKAGRKK